MNRLAGCSWCGHLHDLNRPCKRTINAPKNPTPCPCKRHLNTEKKNDE